MSTESTESTDCPWLKTKKIAVSDLNKMNQIVSNSRHNYFESTIGNFVAASLGTTLKAVTENKSPEYDVIFANGFKAEIKATANQANIVYIETGTESGEKVFKGESIGLKPSGLDLSRSDFYIYLVPSKFGDQDVIKVKIFITSKLREYKSTRPIERGYEKSNTFGFKLNTFRKDLCDFTDGCIGHFLYNPKTTEIDFNTFKGYYKDTLKVIEVLKQLKKGS